MPLPTLNDVHVDKALSNVSVTYIQSQDNFVATRIFPTVPVMNKSDQYPVWDRGDLFRDELEPRAPATESATFGARLAWKTYTAEVRGGKMPIADQTRANADSAVQLEMSVTNIATQKALISVENEWKNSFFKPGVWGTEYGTGAGATAFTKWDEDDSNPIIDIRNAVRSINKYGFRANCAAMGQEAFDVLIDHPMVVDRYKHTGTDITEEMLAKLLKLDKIFVGYGAVNAADELATENTDFILGDSVLICHTPSMPGLMTPAAGYTWAWTGYLNSGMEAVVSRFRKPELRADFVEVETAYDMTIVDAKLGAFISDVSS